MRLIHRVIIILSAAALAMLVGNALILHLLVGEEFRSLENELAVRNSKRAVDAVSNNLAHLRSSAMDGRPGTAATPSYRARTPGISSSRT